MLYKVTYREIDTVEEITEVMDSRMVGGLRLDWAFEILQIEPIK